MEAPARDALARLVPEARETQAAQENRQPRLIAVSEVIIEHNLLTSSSESVRSVSAALTLTAVRA
jgi:hypothetical protein